MFHFRCPHCNTKLEAEDDWAGLETACPECSQNVTIVPDTAPEKPKIKLTPIAAPSLADTQRPISTQPQQPEKTFSSNGFPFVCPACGTLTELDSSLQNQEYECRACCEKSIAVPATEKPCPHCGEMIKFQAKICRFCKGPVKPDKSSSPSSAQRNSSIPQLTPATSSTIMIKEFDTLFFWWWLSLALAIPTFGIGGIASAVFFYMLLYKYWSLVQTETSSMTPGKAVGFLFIPFFGLYWMFVSIWGLGKVFNTLTDLGKWKLETVPLITCICGAAAPLAWVLMIIGVNTVFIIGAFFTLVYLGTIIGGLVFYIITMINFQNAVRTIIQRQ